MTKTILVMSFTLVLIASLALCFVVRAEIPAMSKEELRDLASHELSGTVQGIYERTEVEGELERTYGIAEVAVEKVTKGSDIAAGDRVYVRYWSSRWLGKGVPAPGHYGHWDVPSKSDAVEIFVSGDRKAGFDVLSPNGFFKVTKAKSDSIAQQVSLEGELKELQGRWESRFQENGRRLRVVKTIDGNTETVETYDGKQLVHRHEVKLEVIETEEVCVIKYGESKVTDGPRKGQLGKPGSFVSKRVRDKWYNISGVKPGEESLPSLMEFTRIVDDVD